MTNILVEKYKLKTKKSIYCVIKSSIMLLMTLSFLIWFPYNTYGIALAALAAYMFINDVFSLFNNIKHRKYFEEKLMDYYNIEE